MNDYIEILKPGLMTSIQDMGRKGLSYYAIPSSGVMDRDAAKIALLLLNKKIDGPLVECTYIAPTLKFHGTTRISISGADFGWKLNGNLIAVNASYEVGTGDVLSGSQSSNGMRGYIALEDELILESIFNSYSTYASAGWGGLDGRYLRKGDQLEWTKGSTLPRSRHDISLYKGPEYDWLTEEGKQTLTKNSYKISNETDRMGIRLQGKALEAISYQLPASAPVLPGFIQLPPSGMPIIVLQDGQTTGGYPRIAFMKRESLSKLNQIMIGKELSFILT